MVIISPANVPATPIAESKSNKNIQINMTPTNFVTYIPENIMKLVKETSERDCKAELGVNKSRRYL